MKWRAAVMVVAIPSQKALLICPYVSFGKHRVVIAPFYNLQPISDRRFILASHQAPRMILQLPSFLAFYASKGRAGRPVTSLTTLCASSHTRFQKNSVIIPSFLLWNFLKMRWPDAPHRCLCVQSSMSSHLHNFSYLHLSVLIWLQASVSLFSCFGTSFSAAPFRIMIISWYEIG